MGELSPLRKEQARRVRFRFMRSSTFKTASEKTTDEIVAVNTFVELYRSIPPSNSLKTTLFRPENSYIFLQTAQWTRAICHEIHESGGKRSRLASICLQGVEDGWRPPAQTSLHWKMHGFRSGHGRRGCSASPARCLACAGHPEAPIHRAGYCRPWIWPTTVSRRSPGTIENRSLNPAPRLPQWRVKR